MRHRKTGRKLNMEAAHRKATMHNMARSLVQYELVQTTDAKAKELRGIPDRLIPPGKRDPVHARRRARWGLLTPSLVTKLFIDLANPDELTSRAGGYSRTVKWANGREV